MHPLIHILAMDDPSRNWSACNYNVKEKQVKVYNRSGAGNQPFCNLIAISKDAIIDI